MVGQNLIKYQDKLYWIYRKVKQTHLKEENIQPVKDFWRCDIVLKFKNNEDESLLFLKEITELEVLN